MDEAMAEFTDTTWVALGAIGCAAVLGFLYTLARTVQHEMQALETELRVRRLKMEFARRARARAGYGGDSADEEIIEVDEAPPEPAAAASGPEGAPARAAA